jgi:hypothetical protein
VQLLPAVGADDDARRGLSTPEMDEMPFGVLGHRIPPVPPPPQGEQDVEQVLPFGGQDVLVAGRPVLVGTGLQDAGGDEAVEPLAEDVAGDAQILGEVVEPPDPEERVTDDQQRPAVAEHLDSVRQGAFEMGEVLGAWHDADPIRSGLQYATKRGNFVPEGRLRNATQWRLPTRGPTRSAEMMPRAWRRAVRRRLVMVDQGLEVEIDPYEVVRQLDPGMFEFWAEDDTTR